MVRSGYKRQRNKKGMREGKKWRKREREKENEPRRVSSGEGKQEV
jgi:hypothetical protein